VVKNFKHKGAQRNTQRTLRLKQVAFRNFYCTASKNTKTMLKQLNLPQYSFRIIAKEGTEMILDPIRRKYVKLTPEEWVRQNFVQYLINEGKYPAGLIGIEVMYRSNKLKKRVDILVHNRKGRPLMIVECKSPDIKLTEDVFEQIATYNFNYKVPYIVVTNGMVHYAGKFIPGQVRPDYLLVIPLYEELSD
jgi:virulence-associated protein VagC